MYVCYVSARLCLIVCGYFVLWYTLHALEAPHHNWAKPPTLAVDSPGTLLELWQLGSALQHHLATCCGTWQRLQRGKCGCGCGLPSRRRRSRSATMQSLAFEPKQFVFLAKQTQRCWLCCWQRPLSRLQLGFMTASSSQSASLATAKWHSV